MMTVKNYDNICFQLRNNFYAQLETSLQQELNRLSDNVRNIITSNKKIQAQSVEVLSQIFNLRIKALKWLAAENFNYYKIPEELISNIEALPSNKKLEVLTENILFALRCNQKVINALHKINPLPTDRIAASLAQLPDITYQQFIASLAFAHLDDEITQNIADFTNAALHIEFVLVAADIIRKEKITVSDQTINELAFLIADAAQDYLALATLLGILKTPTTRQNFSNLTFDDGFVEEQKILADLGLEDFVINSSN